ncbi:methyltransferase domain-containing protein [Mycobacterium simiae]|uniref:Methyltransferase domain-containing protein n=1 Tax=Mycobacterium simiae TaxID=1784 RepID=A0A5B1BUY4_MYCSI|nr:methyltransferase domain-containing protein [Mycobacterium simiae]KAA1251143.1 methyltransferase domain-containing protein [Mycobacterium simiae]
MSVGSSGLPRRDVPGAFDAGAPAYDRMVSSNPGYHAHLRFSALRMQLPDHGRGQRLLDAGCGTGASTAALLAVAPAAEIIAVDASSAMLDVARRKSWPASVRFVHSPIEELAPHGVTGPFDAILAAYLLRNVADPDNQLREFRRLLRPGGKLAVHEYSVRDSRAAASTSRRLRGTSRSKSSPAAFSPTRPNCRPPSWPPCSTSTSWAPAKAWSSMSPTPTSM